MKIREGAYYRARRGLIMGPLTRVNWCDRTFAASDITWKENGSYVQGITHSLDLISEVYVRDTPPADVVNPFQNCTIGTYAPETKTLRDEIAMAALKAMLGHSDYVELSPDQMAAEAYRQADAMMEARQCWKARKK